MFHYNKLKDDILNWDGVNFPTGNRDIDRFEENNKLVSINVFETDDCLNDNPPTPALAKAGAAPGTTGGVEPGLSRPWR